MSTYLTGTATGQLVPIFSASDGLLETDLALSIAKIWAQRGDSVMVVDAQGDSALRISRPLSAGKPKARLCDVLFREVDIDDAITVDTENNVTHLSTDTLPLEVVLGSITALSLRFDKVILTAPAGCTPAHARLACAADFSLLLFGTKEDQFIKAFWMVDAVRSRCKDFDPLLISAGDKHIAADAALCLNHKFKEDHGIAPPYIGHSDDNWISRKIVDWLGANPDAQNVA